MVPGRSRADTGNEETNEMMDYLTQAFANLHQMEASRFYVWAVFIAINNVVLLSWISASVLHRESYHATKFSRVWSVVEASLVLCFAIATAPYFLKAEDAIRDRDVTGVQTCALPI